MRVSSRRATGHGQFGPKLLELRLRAGLTQAELAAKLDVPKSTYVAWERSEAEPPMKALLPLARAFRGIETISYLLDYPAEVQGSGPVDWEAFGQVFDQVKAMAKREGYELEDAQVIDIAGGIFDSSKGSISDGLKLVERSIRVTKRR